MSSSRSQRSTTTIFPFRSRKPPVPVAATPPSSSKSAGARPTTPSSTSSSRPPHKLSPSPSEISKPKENVTVTVRFRPLSAREVKKGDEIAWYADGDYTVRNEYNTSIAYAFDRVFGPATTTRQVYDISAQQIVSGAMEGINGAVFAYGVTSSGKTHTMHGEQKSPGIIPLAVKDVFGIIQETPGREFLLRVSYLEIYNEVINDLLDPTGQNLRIREDAQGTYVEGMKEEVVLSPAHALSLIASGEEHRHVGSNNYNLLSSRSHTIFTLTIESSSRGDNHMEEDVALSQLNLIDLAGSESSKAETIGLRRKEGSYINKSLLTLGTVISKLTDAKSTHIPYRDSKLTRVLQSSLSGHGRVSLICTVTPASSNTEETHNTLKFAHRSKHVEIKASQNKILDEKSVIKKYQKEITSLKEELQHLKQGATEKPYAVASNPEDLVSLKLQTEAGQVKLQSRLEEEEQAKAALMGRIQRLTKLILVSTKNTLSSSTPQKTGYRQRHSLGEDELIYLPDKKREYIIDDDATSMDSEFSAEARYDANNVDELVKRDKKSKRHGMLGWFKQRKPENLSGLSSSESSVGGSPATSSKSSQHKVLVTDMRDGQRMSVGRRGDDPSVADTFRERNQAGDLFSATVPSTGTTITDQMDLLREQDQLRKLKNEISEKQGHMHELEQLMLGSIESTPRASNNIEMSQALSKFATQLNEKTFDLEIKSADNRILQEQLQMKMSENAEMQETVLLLRQQLDSLLVNNSGQAGNLVASTNCSSEQSRENRESKVEIGSYEEGSSRCKCNTDKSLSSQVLKQDAEIKNLKQDNAKLTEERDGFATDNQNLAEEASYAKELASAAAIELRNLAEEVTKLSYENAKLTGELAAAKESAYCRANALSRNPEDGMLIEELQNELIARYQREASLEAALSERIRRESELEKRLDEAKQHEEDLENELSNMWLLIAKMRKTSIDPEDSYLEGEQKINVPLKSAQNEYPSSNHARNGTSEPGVSCGYMEELSTLEETRAGYETEKRRCRELESIISKLKGQDLNGLDIAALEELQDLHVEAITKICHAKGFGRFDEQLYSHACIKLTRIIHQLNRLTRFSST
ncbi:hypothetical protein C5167_024070 [Papaver somniferum]|uniref:Kinesin motor domain-containing protein n=1 Tax=Papaver somniferum TaxID=3469 RepID=A0A4Y7JR52_PAPSO|nr:hypothetical protein C5167_024070 [Papaver somniferum]